MATNRVQFQPGLSMMEFMRRYGTQQQCEQALAASRWPKGFACPACGGAHYTSFRRGRLGYRQCTACRHQCSMIAGTIFESTKLALPVWFLAMQLLTQAKNNVSALELRRQLGVSYPTAWLIKHKLMEVMRLREDTRQLSGRVELDDAYLGGERSGGKTGRGSENKVSFVAAVQTTEDGQPVRACFSVLPFTSQALEAFAAKTLVRPLTVVCDGLACFNVTATFGIHERVVTGGGKASAKLPNFRAVNTVLGNLKTAMTGTYHAIKFKKYAHRYLAEVQYRFNRRFDLAAILRRLVFAAAATKPRTRGFIRVADVGC
jgi:ISXO2-like transposase domain/Transposase zinc-ribbon domain